MSTETEAVAKIVEDHANKPDTMVVTDPETGAALVLAVVPNSMKAMDLTPELDKRLPFPKRRTGVIRAKSLAALIEMVNRWKDGCTVVYADDSEAPVITAVMNDHFPEADGDPGFRDHRILYQPELSDEWLAWTSMDEKAMGSEAFALFLEDHILDLVDPSGGIGAATQKIVDGLGVEVATPAKVRGLARDLTVHVNSRVKDARNLQSGEAQLIFESQHTDAEGKPVKIPGAFLVGIPIYKGGPGYLFVARLRYRVGNGLTWSFSLAQTDLAKREVMAEMVKRIKDACGVLVVEGTP